MKRYYYTDPLAAAWMADKFGMKFYCQAGGFFTSARLEGGRIKTYGPNLFDDDNSSIEIEPPSPFYIADDSLHLLEPLIGDLMLLPAGHTWLFGSACIGDFSGSKIIQRNGIAFHWPLEEVVDEA